MKKVKFRNYSNKDASIFKSLNLEWLQSYFYVEPIDDLILNNPKSKILDTGGYIIMAELNDEVIGTFTFIKLEKNIFEFSKMAINPLYRGQGHGNTMMKFAISFAKKNEWKKIILYSNTKLENSIHLYYKYGFLKVEMESDVVYSRGNIKMELNID
tara:strand:- start:310 stop:777 length:468 start_codon:yes stop_codon:yes gene_type:complete